MTHDKLQDAAQRVQDNVQYAKDAVGDVQQKVDTAKQTYEVMVQSGAQNINGGEDMIMQLADTVVSSGLLEKIGAEYGATGAAVVAVLVGLYWTWRKKAQGVENEIQAQKDEEVAETIANENSTEEKKPQEEGQVSSPQEEVAQLKALEEKATESEEKPKA